MFRTIRQSEHYRLRSCSTRINMDNRRLSFVENIFIGSSIFWTRFGPTNENNAVRVCWHDNTIIQMYKAKQNGRRAAIWKVKRQTFSKTKSTIKTTSFRADLRRVFCAFLPRDPDHVLLCVISLARNTCPLYLGHFLSSLATHFDYFTRVSTPPNNNPRKV